jgi:hypothetical protein
MYFVAAGFIWAVLLLFVSGCTSHSTRPSDTKTMEDIPQAYGGNLRKRIGIAPFEVKTTHVDRFARETFQEYVLDSVLAECPGIVFIKPGDGEYPTILTRLPRLENGEVDNFQLALIGRQLGLNAVIVGTLTSVSTEERDWGFWFFKRIRYYVGVQILIEVFDTETATKLLDRNVSREVEIDAPDAEMLNRQSEISVNFIEEVLEIIANVIDDQICDVTEDQIWKSFIASTAESEYLIASGRSSGLQPGHVLEVYDSTQVIQGAQGHRYFKPGPKVGELKITTVDKDHSKAVLISGDNLPQWGVVKIKK